MARKTRLLRRRVTFSKRNLLIFAVLFGVVGGCLVWRSLAAPLVGDVNNDGVVNIQDLSILLSNYGTTKTAADVNGNGTVDIADLSILLSHYGTAIPTVTFSASSTSVTAGGSATLTWSSTHAAGCTASGAWGGTKSTSGSISTGALNNPSTTSTYTLTCSGSGVSVSKSATITAWSADALTYKPNQGIFSLRFDDIPAKDYDFVYPLLKARNLTAGFAVVYNWIDSKKANGDVFLTRQQLLAMQANGMEIMDHSYTHGPSPTNLDDFNHEVVDSLSALRAMGFRIKSFVEPGTWYPGPSDIHSTDYYGTPEDNILRQNYSAYEAYINNPHRILPVLNDAHYGAGHNTGEFATLTNLKAQIDYDISVKQGMEFLFHSALIGRSTSIVPGRVYISDADFIAFLDYVKSKVDSGTLVVMTPTQQLFAKPL